MADVTADFTPGVSLYFFLFNQPAEVWSGSFVPFDVNDWADYAIPLTEGISGIYIGNLPVGVPAGEYYLVGYQMLGSQPDHADTRVLFSLMTWDGTADVAGGSCGTESVDTFTGTVNVEITEGVANSSGVITITEGVR